MFNNWSQSDVFVLAFFWILINCGPTWYVFYSERRVKPNPDRDAKFDPWVRKDYYDWSYFWGSVHSLLYWPRMIIGWIAVSGCIIVANLVDRRSDLNKEELSTTRRKFIMLCFAFFARTHALMGGCVYSRVKRV